MAACHVVLTVWVLRKEFSIPWLIEHWPVTVSGLLCFLLFGLIAAVSNRWGHRRLGESRWASVQELAWIAFVLLIAHLLLLGKMPGWIKWLREFDKPLPPGALTTTVFGLIVLALRGVELIPCRRGGETKSG
jgi:DMSO/TMAO reductase YedYZ heme-binding membrane subunit